MTEQEKDISFLIDRFCDTAKVLNTVKGTNEYVEVSMAFCDARGVTLETGKIFSPIPKEGQTEREIFAQIGSKIVRLGTETTFDSIGAKAGMTIGGAIVTAGTVTTVGLGSAPAYIMGVATGLSVHLGFKYTGVAVGHYVEKGSYEFFLDAYDKYIKEKNIELGNNQNITPDEVKSVVFFDTSKNEKTVYSVDTNNNNNLTQEYKTNITTGATVLLKAGETISHVAVGTNFSTKELLQFNGLSETHAKYLPVGYEVQIPKNVKNLQGGYGNVKLYEGHDGSFTYHIPADKDGNIKIISIDKDGNIIKNEFDSNGTTVLDVINVNESNTTEDYINIIIGKKDNDWNNANDSSITEQETASGGEEYSVVDVRHSDNEQKAKDEYHAKEALDKFSKGEDISLDEVIQAVEKSPTIMNKLKEVLLEKGNNDVASWITEDGKFKADTPSDIKQRVFLETEEGNALSTQLGSTIGGSIGSIIIANNDYSNIEKLAISTSTTVIGQNVGEYLFWDSKNANGTGAFQDIEADYKNTLQGAVVSFAISSFFAKNDTLADILGMDGTFVGGLVDSTVSYVAGYYGTQAISELFASSTASASSSTIGSTAGATSGAVNPLYTGIVGAVGGYLGNAFANKVMGWDTKEEALGASIGSAVGTVAVSVMQAQLIGTLLTLGPVGWIAAVFVVFGGSAIGNVIGGIIGGLFGGSKPPPPKAHAEYEFDEDSLSYNLVSSGSSDGGNEKAMIDIGKSLANHLENMFNIPGGQLVNSDFLPDIKVNQKDKTVKINGERGTFDTVSDMLGNVLIQNIPFINVENGDPYILRAINRTNEAFLETDIHSTNRANLEELYENISLASDYSKYKSETVVLVDKNGNLITDTTKLLEINTLFQAIQNIQDETQKEKALKEFLEEYNFITQKDYVDKLLKENNPEKQDEIDHWKKVFEKVEELQLDTHHYSEDFNKLNSEISKYNYEQSELKGLNNTNYKNNKIFKKVS
ncbi:hypothetical protein AB0W27_01990 [Aliarcobacter butzleri]|uniref:hypothetical protein n=1 Tax=Aliarcobacter butzleri TaxID=28197 RepID=UPI003450D12B